MATKKSGNGAASGFTVKVAKVIQQAQALAAAIEGLGLTALSDEERKHSIGKLRNGEAKAMTSVLDAVDRFPGFFASLADKDGGKDPTQVETAPARDALARSEAISPLVSLLEGMVLAVSDGVLADAEAAKVFTMPAYAIGRAVAPTDAKLRTALAPAISFYGGPARKVAAKKKAAKQAKKKATGATP
jgi:hypothetical protein